MATRQPATKRPRHDWQLRPADTLEEAETRLQEAKRLKKEAVAREDARAAIFFDEAVRLMEEYIRNWHLKRHNCYLPICAGLGGELVSR